MGSVNYKNIMTSSLWDLVKLASTSLGQKLQRANAVP
jgi:hypothetical protein